MSGEKEVKCPSCGSCIKVSKTSETNQITCESCGLSGELDKKENEEWAIDAIQNSVEHEEALSFAEYFIKGWDKEAANVLGKITAGSICVVISIALFAFTRLGLINLVVTAIMVSEELAEIPAWVGMVLNLMDILTVLIFVIGCYYLITGYLHYRKFAVAKEYMLETNIKLRSMGKKD